MKYPRPSLYEPDGMATERRQKGGCQTQKKAATPESCDLVNIWFLWLFGCGGRIWTYDLQVMSLTSYRAAPPRAKHHKTESAPSAGSYLWWWMNNKVRVKIHVTGRPGNDLLSRALRQSTIGAAGFHGRVRNGIEWGTCAITTWSSRHMHLCSLTSRRVINAPCGQRQN